jgi:hypothetical protein
MPIALTILTTTVIGIPIALALAPRRRLATIGAAFLFGSGVVYAVMLMLAIAHVNWSLVNITALALALSAAALIPARRATQQLSNSATTPATPQPRNPATLIDIATALTLTGYALHATIAPVWEWDFWAIWGLKARVFADAATIDWRFLESRWNDFAHPDYPLLLPFNYAYAAMANGGWSDRWLGLYTVAFGAAALLVIRELVADELPPLAASITTFAAAAFVLSGSVGLAEAPLIAFTTAAALFLRRGHYPAAAVLLGLAGSTKNEGLSFLLAIAIAMLLFDRKKVLRLWPAAAIAAPWLLLRAAHGLTTDLLRGPALDRTADHLRHTPEIARLFATNLPDKPIWLFMLAALVFIAVQRNSATQPLSNSATQHATPQPRNVAVILTALTIQLAFFITAYYVTNRNVPWHIATSWPRLVQQLAAPLVVMVMLMLARTFTPEDDHAHAEARPDL